MPTTISGVLATPKQDNSQIALALATLYVAPSNSNMLRIQYGGAGAFVPVARNTALPAPYQFGFSISTDGLGNYSFKLPQAAEIRSPDANFAWLLALPDGTVYRGAPLAGAGPYSIDDLLQSYSWTQTQGLVVTAPLLGTFQKATVQVNNVTSFTVAFAGGTMPDALYQVFPSPIYDTVTQQMVPAYVRPQDKATGQFVISFPHPVTGQVDWLAWR